MFTIEIIDVDGKTSRMTVQENWSILQTSAKPGYSYMPQKMEFGSPEIKSCLFLLGLLVFATTTSTG